MSTRLDRRVEVRIQDNRGERVNGAKLTFFANDELVATIPSTRDNDPTIQLADRNVVITINVECESYIDPATRVHYIDTVTLGQTQDQWIFTIPGRFKITPNIFIGCSVEGRREAMLLQEGFDQYLAARYLNSSTIWWQGFFDLSFSTLESLVEKAHSFTHAVLVLTPDDMLLKRADDVIAARDNVVFELGLFMGALGRKRTFIVAERSVRLPTDLAGIATADFQQDANMGPVITKLLRAMDLL